MARTSKYVKQTSTPNSWRAGLYMRLSKEDGDKSVSESILSQSAIINQFLADLPSISTHKSYIDDGYSGTNFNRPQFLSMINDIKLGKINCVIVKDLSRFGRNYIQAGQYLEGFFPLFNVRFISIGDDIDSFIDPQSVNGISTIFKNVINDEYAHDISIKIKSVLNCKRQNGEFVGAFAPYGYTKQASNRNKLQIDPQASKIVKEIFNLFILGKSIRFICRHLNEMCIPNPSKYKQITGTNFKCSKGKINDGIWSDISVRQILTNQTYAGHLVQGKTQTLSHKIKLRKKVSENQQIVCKNTHDAIISDEMFSIVQSALKRDTRVLSTGKVSLFAGFVKCIDCKRAMIKKATKFDYFYYICSTHEKKRTGCTRHAIRSDKLEQAVFVTIKKFIEIAVDVDKILENINEPTQQTDKNNNQILKLEQAILELYPDFKSNLISKEQYIKLKSVYEMELNTIKSKIFNKKNKRNIIKNDFIRSLKAHKNITKLSREVILSLIEDIFIHKNGGITINFRFEDAYKMAIDYIDKSNLILEERWNETSGIVQSI